MKKLCLLLLLSLAASAWAENPPSPAHSQIDTLHVEKPAPNETAHGHVKVDGILVQLAKTDNPLQLINPAAPERYGSAEDNVVRDPASGKVSGLKFLELRF